MEIFDHITCIKLYNIYIIKNIFIISDDMQYKELL